MKCVINEVWGDQVEGCPVPLLMCPMLLLPLMFVVIVMISRYLASLFLAFYLSLAFSSVGTCLSRLFAIFVLVLCPQLLLLFPDLLPLIGYQEIFGKVKAGGTTQTTSTVLIGHMSASTIGVISPDLQLTRVFYRNGRILPGHIW